MTTYSTIANTEIDAESPITGALLTKMRDNPIAISEGAAGAPKVQTAGITDAAVTTVKIADNNVTGDKAPAFTSGDYVLVTGGEESTSATAYTKLIEYKVGRGGTLSTRLLYRVDNVSATGTFRVYVNGTGVGTEKTTSSTTQVTFDEDISVSVDDLVQVYAKVDNGAFISYVAIKLMTAAVFDAIARHKDY